MSKKKIALTLCAVALTGVLAVGGSLAYFTDETEKVTNVFTTNDKELSGKIVESFDEEKAESFLPGDAIYKEPVLKNDADSINAWAAIKVDILIDSASNLNHALENHKIDLLIDYLPRDNSSEQFEFTVKCISKFDTCFACSNEFYEKNGEKIKRLSDLKNYELIIPGSSRRRQFLD